MPRPEARARAPLQAVGEAAAVARCGSRFPLAVQPISRLEQIEAIPRRPTRFPWSASPDRTDGSRRGLPVPTVKRMYIVGATRKREGGSHRAIPFGEPVRSAGHPASDNTASRYRATGRAKRGRHGSPSRASAMARHLGRGTRCVGGMSTCARIVERAPACRGDDCQGRPPPIRRRRKAAQAQTPWTSRSMGCGACRSFRCGDFVAWGPGPACRLLAGPPAASTRLAA